EVKKMKRCILASASHRKPNLSACRSHEGGNPSLPADRLRQTIFTAHRPWVPAFAGMTRVSKCLHAARTAGVELDAELVEAVRIDGVTHFLHQFEVVMQVVDRVEASAQDLV